MRGAGRDTLNANVYGASEKELSTEKTKNNAGGILRSFHSQHALRRKDRGREQTKKETTFRLLRRHFVFFPVAADTPSTATPPRNDAAPQTREGGGRTTTKTKKRKTKPEIESKRRRELKKDKSRKREHRTSPKANHTANTAVARVRTILCRGKARAPGLAVP